MLQAIGQTPASAGRPPGRSHGSQR